MYDLNHPKIKFIIRDFGEITAELYPEKAPRTVANFLHLVDEGFYSGLIFHRVISGFMIQGGGFNESFEQMEAAAIPGEFFANGYSRNDLHHAPGVLSMARTNDPNSASSQFFIMHKDAAYLDRQYAGFGQVIEGMDVVDRIAAVPTGRMGWYDDVPRVPVVIESVVRVED
ncbi:MAG: peptidylprolyl isomerase [Ruminococcaceae bacterium]|nr:peptidylprolyl isomerase [Oscillospiraceae bacterium]